MADNNITFKVFVDQSSGTATIRNLKGEIQATEVPIKQLRQQFGNFVKEVNAAKFKRFKKELDSTIGSQQSFKNASGGATSAVLELGRVVQDAPYGLRGMANNITQLASQMAFATKSAGGFGKALGQMGKAMMGPLGVVFAISAVVSILETMDSSNKKAKKSSDALSETFGEESTKLMVLNEVLQDSSVSMEAKTEIVKKANKEFQDLNITLDENGNITDETAKKIDALSVSFIKNAKARAIAKLIQDEMVEQSKIEAQKAGENLKWYEVAYFGLVSKIKGTSYDFSSAIKADSENQKESLKESSDAIKRYMDLLKKDDAELAKLLFGGNKKGKAKKKPKVEELVNLPDAEEVRKYYEDVFNALGDANTFEKALDQLNVAKASGHISEEFFDEMKSELEKKFASQNIMNGVAPKLELGENAKKAIEDYNKKFFKMMAEKLDLEDWSEYADKFSEGLSAVSNFIDAQFEADLTREQNKTNALNEELNNRLLNENLSKDERAKIQQEIWQNDEKLRKKQNEIKKKQFNTQKAFNIAMAVADTAGATMKAYSSQLIPGDPTSIIRAKIAAGVAAAFGALQIATIASQKFQPESASTPIRTASGGAGGGGGVGDRSFNFNLVGASQQNQLLNAIQGQFDKPLKAYVVSKDITNQQQLDANTKSTARFGG